MKRIFFTLFTLILFTAAFAGNGYEVSYSEPQAGTLQLQFNLGEYAITTTVLDGQVFSKIRNSCSLHTEKEGWAELPKLTSALQLSADANYDLVFIGGEYSDFKLDHPLVPSRGTIYRNQDPSKIPYEIDPASIVDDYYPLKKMEMTDPYIIKDVRGTTITVYPFQYNAALQTLRVYSSMNIHLVQNSESATNPLSNSKYQPLREMIGIYESAFINYTANQEDLTIADNGEILVICTSRDESAIQPYIDWKTEKGYVVYKEVVSTGTNVDDLVQTKYNENNNILFVVLVGDWNDIKCANSGGTPEDPRTGCVVGNDNYFDICIGRISAGTPSEVTVQVNKIIDYERNPDMGATWYKAATGIASNQGSGDDNEDDDEHIQIIYDDKLSTFTYDSHTPIYDPSASSSMVTNTLNNGTSIINYCGHGSSTSWGSSGFSNSHIATLSNGNKLPFIFSVACVNGAYHSNTCFAEAWMRKDGGGAVGTLMSTINQPWDPPMRGQDYFNDMIIGGYDYSAHPGQNGINTTEGRTTFGAIVFNGLVLMITESPGDLNTANTWILFGDPAMQVRTDTPADLSCSNSVMLVGTPFETSISKDGSPYAGAMVAISQNGVTYSEITDATGAVSIDNNFLPGDVQLVVTAFNSETIYETIQCIPPTGPYVIYADNEINDVSGNNNGILEYLDGNVLLNFTMKNVGVAQATNVQVSISTNDPYITITDGSENYGNLTAGEVKTINNAFAFDVAEDVPDGHGISFVVTAVGQETWESAFSLVAHSAALEYLSYIVDDSNGNNNGLLDPGETAPIIVTVGNTGSAEAFNVLAGLISSDPHISILTTQPQGLGNFEGGATGEATFNVNASASIPPGYVAEVDVVLNADMGVSGSGSFDILFPDYCEASTNTEDEWIAQVICGDIDNSTGWQGGVANYTDMTTTLEPGVPVAITIENGNAWANDKVTVWIDWNLDMELGNNSNETFVLTNVGGSGQTFTGEITAPADQAGGQFRMRVRMTYSSDPEPCGSSSYGEVEDYTVVIGSIVLPPPLNLGAQITGDDVTITWAPPEPGDVSGYNIYRDGEMISSMITVTTFTDIDCPDGSYWYAVTAVYPEGESPICEPVQVTIGLSTCKIQGFVRDAYTNMLIPNAWVSALNSDFGAVTYSTPFGSHFSLFLAAGTYDLFCDAEGYQPETMSNIIVQSGGLMSLQFYLYPELRMQPGEGFKTSVNEMTIFPNPATDQINIFAEGLREIQIYSQTGQLMIEKQVEGNNAMVEIQNLEASVYFIKLITVSGIINEKLVIN